jgi:hypothetical protein
LLQVSKRPFDGLTALGEVEDLKRKRKGFSSILDVCFSFYVERSMFPAMAGLGVHLYQSPEKKNEADKPETDQFSSKALVRLTRRR